MPATSPLGEDATELVDSIPVSEIRDAINKLVTDPSWESPETFQLTPTVAVQVTRLVSFNGVGGSVEVLVRSDSVDTSPLITLGEANSRLAETKQETVGEVPIETMQAAAALPTRGVEVPEIQPVCAVLQGMLVGLPDENGWVTRDGEVVPTMFTYAFEVNQEGTVVEDPSFPYDQGRVNPFDSEAHVFVQSVELNYTVEEMPEETHQSHWEMKQEDPVRDVVAAPNPKATETDVGDVFFNTQTQEYCWIIGFSDVLGALLQYEDGTFWDQQLRPDGVPAGPYERCELPDDYNKPVPQPTNPCEPGDHDFGVENPTSFHDIEPALCHNCGLATSTLIELYSQWPLNHVEFACIGCGTTGPGKEIISSDRLSDTAMCESCWDPSLSAHENYEKHQG